MKEIQAIIQPFMLEKVLRALAAVHDLPGLTVSEVAGWGRTQAEDARHIMHHAGHAFATMTKLQVVVPDGMAEGLVETLRQAAHTGSAGDGKIFMYEVVDVVRIRTGEQGEAAV